MSLISTLVYSLMHLIRYRQGNGKRFRNELVFKDYPGRLIPAEAPAKLREKFESSVSEVLGNRVITLSAKKDPDARVAIFFHGGAYIRKAVSLHWSFVDRWLERFGGRLVFPDYPLAPEHTCLETIAFAEAVYLKVIADGPLRQLILMGDSSGGGLSLALRQLIRDKGYPEPAHTILFCPWIDLGMEDPEIDKLERSDPMLPARELRLAGKAYAGDLDIHDPRVSPIRGNLGGLGSLSLFAGTRELLLPDARRMRDLCSSRGIPLNYFEYRGMIHDWMLLPLPEARRVLEDIGHLIEP
jgi:acetyl esterase/lipase